MRIAKYIANSGYCSRRDAEKLIKQRKVYINDNICDEPFIKVSQQDLILINGKKVELNLKLRLWKFNKPIKTLCTNKDPKNRKTIFSLFPKKIPRLISVGRLDYLSEGLILLTNNGDFARKLELPSSNILRVYDVYLKNSVNKKEIERINDGIKINEIRYKKIYVKIEKNEKKFCCLKFKLFEGKNREIRNICKHLNWPIIKLKRLQFGPIKLKKENPGEIIEIDPIPEFFPK